MSKGFDLSASFEFIAKYPIQMLIAGGILLLILAAVFSGTASTTGANALNVVAGQLASWGWIILIIGVIVLIIYLYFRYGQDRHGGGY